MVINQKADQVLMEIDINTLNYALDELNNIKLLLIVIEVSLLILVFSFFIIAKTLMERLKINEQKDKLVKIENQLDSGLAAEAIASALQLLN